MRKSNQDVPTASSPRLRCAIYTRKSTEEGLEQEFNSLDAQREAAEAFIQSQRREGWIALPQLYDDGGFTDCWSSKLNSARGYFGPAGKLTGTRSTDRVWCDGFIEPTIHVSEGEPVSRGRSCCTLQVIIVRLQSGCVCPAVAMMKTTDSRL